MIDDVVFSIWLILFQCNDFFYSWLIYCNVSIALFRVILVISGVVFTTYIFFYYRLGMKCIILDTDYNLLNYIITLNLYFWCMDTNEFHYYDILITFYGYALIFILFRTHNYIWAYSCGHWWNNDYYRYGLSFRMIGSGMEIVNIIVIRYNW